MAHIDTWFPTAIYVEENLFSKTRNGAWSDYILKVKTTVPCGGEEWLGNTYTTLLTYNLKECALFNDLIKEVTNHVNKFTSAYNSSINYVCHDAWGNVAEEKQYQEFHNHPGSVFSAVYYSRVPEGSGGIMFEDPRGIDMLPITGISEVNSLSCQRVTYHPEEGKLIIFRSSLRHAVVGGTNKEPRISFSFNFGT